MKNKFPRIHNIVTAILVTAIALSPSVSAISEADQSFYASNDILFYDPDAIKCTLGTAETSSKLPIEQRIAQLFIVGFDGADNSMLSTVEKFSLGGVYFNGKQSPLDGAKVKSTNDSLPTGLLVASDDEGGQISRFLKGQPSAKKLGTMSDAQVKKQGESVGTQLKKSGVNMLLAPVLDIDVPGLNNGISNHDRSFSSNPDTVATKAGVFATAVASKQVGVTFKHFPGLSKATANTDFAEQKLKGTIDDYKNDLIPYQKLKGTKNASVMLANFSLSGWGNDSISINEKAVTYLRSKVGFDGMITTDDINALTKYSNMKLEDVVVKALNAGVSMPLFHFTTPEQMSSVIQAVQAGVSEQKINAALNIAVAYKKSIGIDTTKVFKTSSTMVDTSTSSSGGKLSSEYKNIGPALKYLTGTVGMNLAQASGLVGNMIQESGVRPDIIQGGATASSTYSPVSGVGFGLIQWTFTPRQKPLVNLSKSTNRPIIDLGLQLDYINKELTTDYKSTTQALTSHPDFTAMQAAIVFHGRTGSANASGVNGVSGLSSDEKKLAADAFRAAPSFGYEASADSTSGVIKRAKNAALIYNEFKGKIQDGTGFGSGMSTSGGTIGDETFGCGGSSSQAVASGTCAATVPVRGEGSTNKMQRTQAELTGLYGPPDDMKKNLVSVDFLGHSIQVHKLVAPCLEAVANEIKTNNINYKVNEMGGYRRDGNGRGQIGDKSYHSYGAAVDINPSKNGYYEGTTGPYDIPQAYVDAFHHHGWSWGGNWNSSKDYMHFEYNG